MIKVNIATNRSHLKYLPSKVTLYNGYDYTLTSSNITHYLSFRTSSIIIYVKAQVGIVNDGIIPEEYSLSNNYPNPFNPQTTISYGLPKQSDLSLIIYNIMGHEIMR